MPLAVSLQDICTGQIDGTAVDASGQLASGATVQIEGSAIIETTGSDGRGTIRSALAGEQGVTVRYFGAETAAKAVIAVPGQLVALQVSLGGAEAATAEGEITITAPLAYAKGLLAGLAHQLCDARLRIVED